MEFYVRNRSNKSSTCTAISDASGTSKNRPHYRTFPEDIVLSRNKESRREKNRKCVGITKLQTRHRTERSWGGFWRKVKVKIGLMSCLETDSAWAVFCCPECCNGRFGWLCCVFSLFAYLVEFGRKQRMFRGWRTFIGWRQKCFVCLWMYVTLVTW